MHHVSFLDLLYMEELKAPTTTSDSSKPMTTSTTPCMPMMMPAVTASSAFDLYPPLYPYYQRLYFPPSYPPLVPSLPLHPVAPAVAPHYIQQHQPSPAPSWSMDSPPPRSTHQFTSPPPGEAIVQPILPSQQNLFHPPPRAPRPARAARPIRAAQPVRAVLSKRPARRQRQQRQQQEEEAQQTQGKPKKRKRQSDSRKRGSPSESSSPLSKPCEDDSARSTPTPSSRAEAAIETLETELGYLRGDYATICIMLNSLRTTFVPTPETPEVSRNPDIEREKRVAFDDLVQQIRHLERNIEKLETDLVSKCSPPQKRLKKE